VILFKIKWLRFYQNGPKLKAHPELEPTTAGSADRCVNHYTNIDSTGEIGASRVQSFHFLAPWESSSLQSTFGVIRTEGAWVVRMCSVSASLGVAIGKVITRPTDHPPQMPPAEADKLLNRLTSMDGSSQKAKQSWQRITIHIPFWLYLSTSILFPVFRFNDNIRSESASILAEDGLLQRSR